MLLAICNKCFTTNSSRTTCNIVSSSGTGFSPLELLTPGMFTAASLQQGQRGGSNHTSLLRASYLFIPCEHHISSCYLGSYKGKNPPFQLFPAAVPPNIALPEADDSNNNSKQPEKSVLNSLYLISFILFLGKGFSYINIRKENREGYVQL